jgi:hypothetical protein
MNDLSRDLLLLWELTFPLYPEGGQVQGGSEASAYGLRALDIGVHCCSVNGPWFRREARSAADAA